LIEAIDLLTLELRHQYVLGFAPANAAPPGKWNKVKIKVRTPDRSLKGLSAHSREGYFSPAPTPAP
jgi:Ca-activated chloride channel family protein